MASNTKKTKCIRNRKKAPNRNNLKASIERIQRNSEILRDLASNEKA
jgi:hypothetical protein